MSKTVAAHKAGYINEREAKMWREVVTPEGATINLRLADAAERAGALMIDAAIMLATLIAVALALIFMASIFNFQDDMSELITVVWFLFFFVMRALYFTLFEMGRRAATPGKRLMRLRVVAREGRQLTANAVFARNVMRELEVFLPFIVLMGGPGDTQISGLLTLCLIVWLGVFVLMPVFTKDKLRAGDIVAGTWVIRNPKLELENDISLQSTAHDDDFRFSTEQLQAYGEHELQVLEDVLRGDNIEIQAAVADRIRKRIGWEKGPKEANRDFLEAFYKGLRKTLETRMLFGNRKRDKHDAGDASRLS